MNGSNGDNGERRENIENANTMENGETLTPTQKPGLAASPAPSPPPCSLLPAGSSRTGARRELWLSGGQADDNDDDDEDDDEDDDDVAFDEDHELTDEELDRQEDEILNILMRQSSAAAGWTRLLGAAGAAPAAQRFPGGHGSSFGHASRLTYPAGHAGHAGHSKAATACNLVLAVFLLVPCLALLREYVG